jgi:hypothetical protein
VVLSLRRGSFAEYLQRCRLLVEYFHNRADMVFHPATVDSNFVDGSRGLLLLASMVPYVEWRGVPQASALAVSAITSQREAAYR